MQITNSGAQNCIEVKGVDFKYNKHLILNDVSFNIKCGEYVGIIGPNGGGKTTLIKIILGLLKPLRGEVKIFGYDLNQFKERFLIGYVPQKITQEAYFPATVEEIVKSGIIAKIGPLKKFTAKDNEAARKAMEATDIGKYKNELLSHLSGGEKQRVFIARALAGEPKILILDEPVAGVDAPSQEQFYQFLNSLRKESALTIIYVSHDLNFIAQQVESVLCLNRKLICNCPPKEFIKEGYLEELYGKDIKLIEHTH